MKRKILQDKVAEKMILIEEILKNQKFNGTILNFVSN